MNKINHQKQMIPLLLTAIYLGAFHAFIGPDHYVPFVALAKSRNWNFFKTLIITFVCGIGHVMSSVLIGLVGIAIGASFGMLENIESVRGDITKYLLLAFGLAYLIYGLKRIYKTRPHAHVHIHDGHTHSHVHTHEEIAHTHFHEDMGSFWAIFLIFVFGPCEVLIPLVMAPAMEFNWGGVVLISSAFSIATIITMLSMVSILFYGAEKLNFNPQFFKRWGHAISGLTIMSCAGLMFLGL